MISQCSHVLKVLIIQGPFLLNKFLIFIYLSSRKGQKPQLLVFIPIADLHQRSQILGLHVSLSRSSIITPIFLRNNRNKFLVSDFSSPGFSCDQPRPVRTQRRWLTLMVTKPCKSPGTREIYCDSEKRSTGPWFQENEWLHLGQELLWRWIKSRSLQ